MCCPGFGWHSVLSLRLPCAFVLLSLKLFRVSSCPFSYFLIYRRLVPLGWSLIKVFRTQSNQEPRPSSLHDTAAPQKRSSAARIQFA